MTGWTQFSAMDTEGAQRMTDRIRTVIQDRASLALALLIQLGGEGLDPDDLDPAWQIKDLEGVPSQKPFDHAFYGLVNGLTQIKTAAESLFASSMLGGHHDPSAGLFIGFLVLMDQIRDRANRFMERYLDFYLYEVLRTVPDPGSPEPGHSFIPGLRPGAKGQG